MVTMVNVIHPVLVCRSGQGEGQKGRRSLLKVGWGVEEGWGGEEGWVGEEGWGWDGWGGEEGGFIAGEVFETLLHNLLCVMGV